ncbi:Lipase maturation factor [Babesia duncani]|uniref:Lipase maturation factor n=1 Tax=Babesia duncani TaxID=323732 RepID=A0AAD9UQ48_9APIC|nr:Lipase maturation factor [Babesia duncani]
MALVDDVTPQSYGDAVYNVEHVPSSPLIGYAYNNEETMTDGPFEPIIIENQKSLKNQYYNARDLFARLLALVYIVAFFQAIMQLPAIVGSDGVWPANVHANGLIGNIDEVGFWKAITQFPGLFAILPITDFYIYALPVLGIITALSIFITGFAGCYSFAFLWVIKLSLSTLMIQLPRANSDALLLEAGFLTIFLFSPFVIFDRQGERWKVPVVCRWGFKWLAYRIIFCAGFAKLRGNPKWFELTAFKYLMKSIALPSPFTYFLFKFADGHPFANTLFTASMLFMECVLSLFIILPIRKCTIIGGYLIIFYSVIMSLIGNFGIFYILLGILSVFCFDDYFLNSCATSKYNVFSKVNLLCRQYSEKVIDVFEPDLGLDANKVEEKEETFVRTMIDTLTYQSRKNWIQNVIFTDEPFGYRIESDKFRFLQQCVQVLFVVNILLLCVGLTIGNRNRYMKSFLIFIFAVLLQVQSGAIGTSTSYILVGTTLFTVHVWLFCNMLLYGPGLCSFALWVAMLELQIGLSNSNNRLVEVSHALIQSCVFMYIAFYSLPLMARTFGAREITSISSPFSVVNSYDTMGSFGDARTGLVIQGTLEQHVNQQTKWKDINLRAMPGSLNDTPPLSPYYDYVLDTLVQKAARDPLQSARDLPPYMFELLRKLLQGSSTVTRMFKHYPFTDAKPRYVRIVQYEYEFATQDKQCPTCEKGSWYTRRFLNQLVPPLTLEHNDKPQKVVKRPIHHQQSHKSGKDQQRILHVVHQMPAATNGKSAPLEMADELTQQYPQTDALLLTRI